MRKSIKILLAILLVLIIAGAGFVIWANGAPAPMPEAMAALQSDQDVNVTVGDWLVFKPANGSYETGYIFYSGGKVDYRSYAPYANEIAKQGYLVVIPKMPLNLAVFSPNIAGEVIAAFPEVKNWALGGHSLGGSMASSFIFSTPEFNGALVLLASYPASSNDLSTRSGLIAYSISGSNDGLATPEKIKASYPLLPPSTVFVEIKGGNHAQFGWYGSQSGDLPADISREDQQMQVVQLTLDALIALENGK